MIKNESAAAAVAVANLSIVAWLFKEHLEKDSLLGEPLVLFFWFNGISKAVDSLLKSLNA